MNSKTDKKRIAALILLAVVILSGIIIACVRYANRPLSQCQNTATSPLYVESVGMVNRSLLISDDNDIAKKIEKDKGYTHDVNCLYPLIKYYEQKKDDQKVQDLFELFSKYYGDDKKSSKMYKDYDVKTYEDVKKQVDEYVRSKGNNNVIFF